LNFSLQRYKIINGNPRKWVHIFSILGVFLFCCHPATHLPQPYYAHKQGVSSTLVAVWQQNTQKIIYAENMAREETITGLFA
jgi:hypothetical protein